VFFDIFVSKYVDFSSLPHLGCLPHIMYIYIFLLRDFVTKYPLSSPPTLSTSSLPPSLSCYPPPAFLLPTSAYPLDLATHPLVLPLPFRPAPFLIFILAILPFAPIPTHNLWSPSWFLSLLSPFSSPRPSPTPHSPPSPLLPYFYPLSL